MRLNVGCGRHVLDGWTNIDIAQSPNAKRPPELLSDIRTIPLPDACADELMAIHVFEHFYLWECPALLREWHRLLKAGGLMILELPDIYKSCKNVIDGTLKGGKELDQLGMWGLYGDPREMNPYMCHRWGWSPATLMPYLKDHGFTEVRETVTQWHPAGKRHRDMRIEARKG